MRLNYFILIFFLMTSGIIKAQHPNKLFTQDDLKLAGKGYAFTEGCSRDPEGNVYFTDQPNDKIWKYDVIAGTLTLFRSQSGRANGTYIDPKGTLYVCADENGTIWSVDTDGKEMVLLTQFEGKQLNGPNDLWLDAKGGIFFTDPYYQRDYWTRTKPELAGQDVYYLPKAAKQAIKVASGLKQPNGIVGSPDGKYLYVADIADGKTYQYKISGKGRLSNRKLIVAKGSDGMTLDSDGNLYLTSGEGVQIVSPSGEVIGVIQVLKGASNVCFAGRDRNILFITAKDAIYTIPMRSTGLE